MTQSYEVKAGFDRIEAMTIAGVSVVTDNQRGAEDINALWERFFKEQIGQKLQDHKDNDLIYAVYSDYEGDHTKPYRLTIGYKLKSTDLALDNLHTVTTEAADYAMLSAAGEQPKALIDTWTMIWQSDLDRRFQTDLEIYGPRFFEDQVNEVLIAIGVNA